MVPCGSISINEFKGVCLFAGVPGLDTTRGSLPTSAHRFTRARWRTGKPRKGSGSPWMFARHNRIVRLPPRLSRCGRCNSTCLGGWRSSLARLGTASQPGERRLLDWRGPGCSAYRRRSSPAAPRSPARPALSARHAIPRRILASAPRHGSFERVVFVPASEFRRYPHPRRSLYLIAASERVRTSAVSVGIPI